MLIGFIALLVLVGGCAASESTIPPPRSVVIYSGATILGNITIGEGSVIGGNVWLVNDVSPESSIYIQDGSERYGLGSESSIGKA